MIHTKYGVRCERCGCLDDVPGTSSTAKRRLGATNDLLRALGTGPKTRHALARAVYGREDLETRCKIGALLRGLGDAVEGTGKVGEWRLAVPASAPRVSSYDGFEDLAG